MPEMGCWNWSFQVLIIFSRQLVQKTQCDNVSVGLCFTVIEA